MTSPAWPCAFRRVVSFIRQDKNAADATIVAEARDMFANQGVKPDMS